MKVDPSVPIPGFLLKRTIKGGMETATDGLRKRVLKGEEGLSALPAQRLQAVDRLSEGRHRVCRTQEAHQVVPAGSAVRRDRRTPTAESRPPRHGVVTPDRTRFRRRARGAAVSAHEVGARTVVRTSKPMSESAELSVSVCAAATPQPGPRRVFGGASATAGWKRRAAGIAQALLGRTGGDEIRWAGKPIRSSSRCS